MYEISKEYRTIHSIKDDDVNRIKFHFESLEFPKNFVDFGCHLGHLSIQMAIDYPVEIFAVDNFCGTKNDGLMASTLKPYMDDGSFYNVVNNNVKDCSYNFKGNVIIYTTDEFFVKIKDGIDFCYCDSSHDKEEYNNIIKI